MGQRLKITLFFPYLIEKLDAITLRSELINECSLLSPVLPGVFENLTNSFRQEKGERDM